MGNAVELHWPKGKTNGERNSIPCRQQGLNQFTSEGSGLWRTLRLRTCPQAAVLIGANGSGKSNFIRFFEMLSWMLLSRRLGEFVERQGGADDQLFGGNRTTPRMEAEIRMRTDRGPKRLSLCSCPRAS